MGISGEETTDNQAQLFSLFKANLKSDSFPLYPCLEHFLEAFYQFKQQQGEGWSIKFRNEYDGHTLPEALEQVKRLTGQEPETATVDRGYAEIKQYGQTEVIKPERLKKGSSWRPNKKYKERLRKRIALESTIGH